MKRQIKRTLGILLVVCFALSMTTAAISAAPVNDSNLKDIKYEKVQKKSSDINEKYLQIKQKAKPLRAIYTANPTSGPAPLTVTFTSRSPGNPVKWFWVFDDGTYSYEKNPVHTYDKPGRYWPKLTLYDEYGKKDWDWNQIAIEVGPGRLY